MEFKVLLESRVPKVPLRSELVGLWYGFRGAVPPRQRQQQRRSLDWPWWRCTQCCVQIGNVVKLMASRRVVPGFGLPDSS